MASRRPALIVIHGWGGTFAEAVHLIEGLLDFHCRWDAGVFYVDKREGGLLRHILRGLDPNRYMVALQKIILGRFLAASAQSGSGEAAAAAGEYSFSENRLFTDFAAFGLPFAPAARERRAKQLREEAVRELDPVMPAIKDLDAVLSASWGAATDETEARRLIEERASTLPDGEALVKLLETVRGSLEVGGDVDTVTGAVFYTYALQSAAREEGRDLEYGRDYRYAFVNYHEGLRRLAAGGPADVYIADLSLEAIPLFEDDVAFLATHGVRIRRFEDHHPCSPEKRAMLERLVAEGAVGFAALSGPEPGEQLEASAVQCGADMVYGELIRGKPWECKGAETLHETAHAEDFVRERTDIGKLLTSLIKGGACKLEIAKVMLDSIPGNDLAERLREHGWEDLVATWNAALADAGERLAESVLLLHLERGSTDTDAIGPGLGAGSDVVLPPTADDDVQVLMALAPTSEPGKPRITIGTATEYYVNAFPDADYLFYCYGSRLMQARRINQGDLTLNLGVLMSSLGTEADGGHAGAAVCRPESNPAYPLRLLGRVSGTNFDRFARYMAFRMADAGCAVRSVKDHSAMVGHRLKRGGKRIVMFTGAAVLLGLLLMLLWPGFRPGAVRDSNEGFCPHIPTEDASP